MKFTIQLIFNLFLLPFGLFAQSTDYTKEHLFTEGIEGPACDKYGNLYAVNFAKEGTIGIIDKKGEARLFAELPEGSIGNGIRFDKKGNMYIADYKKHNVLLIPRKSDKAVVYAHESRANQPNDLAISPSGLLFASDPNWKEGTGKLWRIEHNRFVLLEENMGTTNGIEVSPDGKLLYVNESVSRTIWKYALNKKGQISDKKVFHQFTDFGMDGMRCDVKGNLYVCRFGAGKIAVINPEGALIKTIILKGINPTNITFGGKENKQCFVTLADRGCIETFTADFAGR
jgi:gluconolactonase